MDIPELVPCHNPWPIAHLIPRRILKSWLIIRDDVYHYGVFTNSPVGVNNQIRIFTKSLLPHQFGKCNGCGISTGGFNKVCSACYSSCNNTTIVSDDIFMYIRGGGACLQVNGLLYDYYTDNISLSNFGAYYPAYCVICHGNCHNACLGLFISDIARQYLSKYLVLCETVAFYDIRYSIVCALIIIY